MMLMNFMHLIVNRVLHGLHESRNTTLIHLNWRYRNMSIYIRSHFLKSVISMELSIGKNWNVDIYLIKNWNV